MPASPLSLLGSPEPTNSPGLIPLPLSLSMAGSCHSAAPALEEPWEQLGDSAREAQAGKV